MFGLDKTRLILIVGVIALYLVSTLRVALTMRRTGRNVALWFLLSLLLTAVPATIVLWRDRRNSLKPIWKSDSDDETADDSPDNGAIRRCPHCQEPLSASTPHDATGRTRCPRCRQAIDETHYA